MRRLVFSIIVASGLVLVGAGSASAAPTLAVGAVKAVPGKKVCKIQDPRLDELSGLIATKGGFITVDDSTTESSHKRVFYLDTACKVVKQVKYSGNGPRDTEDMALSPDGNTLWIGDIGDNDRTRTTIGLWKMPADGSKSPVLYRVRYPQGDGPYDAEGLMINGDGNPIVVTKDPEKVSLFVPTGPLKPGETDGVVMKRAGELRLPSTTTENKLGAIGRLVATGASVSPDRSKVVIRTYADAFEWPVTNGDLIAAVKGTPTSTPLPNEPQGESVAFSADGSFLYTVSDMQGDTSTAENDILRYSPAAAVSPAKSAGAAGGSGKAAKKPSWFSTLSLDDITYMVGAVGLIGAILVGFGIFGIVRSRRRPPVDPSSVGDDYPDGPGPLDAETELLTVGGPPNGQRPGTYGAPQAAAYRRPGPGGVPPRGNGVYGGAPSAGRPGAGGRPAQPGGRPGQGGQPMGRPGPGGQPAGRPGQGQGQPGGRPGQGGQPGGRPAPGGGQPGGRPAPGGRPVPGGGQGGRPAPGGGQGGRPAPGGGQGGRPAPGGGQGGRPAPGGGQGGRPAPGGGQGGRPAPGGGQGGRPAPGGQTGARPAPGGGQQPTGRPARGGVYGVPPSGPPPSRGGQPGPSQRSGYHPDGGRQAGQGGYADVNGAPGRGRDYDNPGYGRPPYDR